MNACFDQLYNTRMSWNFSHWVTWLPYSVRQIFTLRSYYLRKYIKETNKHFLKIGAEQIRSLQRAMNRQSKSQTIHKCSKKKTKPLL